MTRRAETALEVLELLEDPEGCSNTVEAGESNRPATRTLHRYLAAEDTNFRRLVGEVRGALAEAMLSHRMTVAEVAERLGYAEVASLSPRSSAGKGAPPASTGPAPEEAS